MLPNIEGSKTDLLRRADAAEKWAKQARDNEAAYMALADKCKAAIAQMHRDRAERSRVRAENYEAQAAALRRAESVAML